MNLTRTWVVSAAAVTFFFGGAPGDGNRDSVNVVFDRNVEVRSVDSNTEKELARAEKEIEKLKKELGAATRRATVAEKTVRERDAEIAGLKRDLRKLGEQGVQKLAELDSRRVEELAVAARASRNEKKALDTKLRKLDERRKKELAVAERATKAKLAELNSRRKEELAKAARASRNEKRALDTKLRKLDERRKKELARAEREMKTKLAAADTRRKQTSTLAL